MRRGYNSGDSIKFELGKLEFDYTGQAQGIVLPKGYYYLQCWGAQGGVIEGFADDDQKRHSRGGYAAGYINLNRQTPLYVYVGGTGNKDIGSYTTDARGGFNGGGDSFYIYTYSNKHGAAGGGGTDIRISEDSLFSRVIVAGGGGGCNGLYAYSDGYGGFGGGVEGSPGLNEYASEDYDYGGGGARGTKTGNSTRDTSDNGSNFLGSFGQGSNSTTSELEVDGSYETVYLFPGGGGWYGGAAGYPEDYMVYETAPGGGGSGYIYNADNAQYYPNGCLLNPEYYIKGGVNICVVTEDGYSYNGKPKFSRSQVNSFPSPTGGTESGHSGNGYCVISGYAIYDKDEDSELIIPYTKSGTYSVPTGMTYADIFLVNGGNGGSGFTNYSGRIYGFGGQGGNTYSATNVSLTNAVNITVAIGSGGASGSTGGTTILQLKNASSTVLSTYQPTAQSTATTYATTGTTAKNGTPNPINLLDPNYYGANGGLGNGYNGYSDMSEGYNGGNTGGGKGGFSASNERYGHPGKINGGNGSFYGAGGGGASMTMPANKTYAGKGYQGICIIKWKKQSS